MILHSPHSSFDFCHILKFVRYSMSWLPRHVGGRAIASSFFWYFSKRGPLWSIPSHSPETVHVFSPHRWSDPRLFPLWSSMLLIRHQYPLLDQRIYSKGHASSMRVCVLIRRKKYPGDDPLLLAFIITGNLHNFFALFSSHDFQFCQFEWLKQLLPSNLWCILPHIICLWVQPFPTPFISRRRAHPNPKGMKMTWPPSQKIQ